MTDRNPLLDLADDEALSALIDGMLTAAQAQALRERLANEPALAARLAALENADAALRAGYSSVADEPLPTEIVALLQPRARAASVVALGQPRQWWVPSALAAGIALAVGLAIGVPLGQQRGDTSAELGLAAAAGAIRPGDGLYAVLDSAPSGETRPLGGGMSATPRLTFRATTGAYCRQIGLSVAGGRTEALACREDDAWTLRAAAFEPQMPAAGDATVYRTASRSADALDATVDALIDGQPLNAQAEAEVMASHWAGE
jgi:hypothetical protein